MPRLPTMQKRFISPNQQDYISPAVNNLAQSLQYVGQVANKIQDVQDTTNANKELSTFKLEATQKAEELALQYGDNPKQYEEEFGKYIEESKGSLVDNSQVSVFNKNSFKNLVDNSVIDLEEIKFKNTRQLQASKVKNDIQATSDNLLNLSYKYGKDGDIEQLDNLQNIELSKLESGAKEVYTSGERQALMKSARQNNYTQFLTGQVVANPQEAINMIDAGVYNEKIDYATIDELKAKAVKFIENASEKSNNLNLTSGGFKVNPILNNEALIQLDNRLNEFQIKSKDGKSKINNDDLNNTNDIVDYMNYVDTLYNQNSITTKQKRRLL